MSAMLGLSIFLFFPFFNAPTLDDRGGDVFFQRLPSGARVIVKEASWAPVVAIDFWLDAGSRHDPQGMWGTAHFLEHLVMRGGKGVNFSIEMLGGEANAATSRDFVRFYALVPSAQFEEALLVLADALAKPSFDPKAMEEERKVILSEMKAVYEEPLRLALEVAFELAYRAHPYGHPVEGTPRSLSLITPEVLRQFHKERYVAPNICLVVVGDVGKERALSAAREALRLFPPISPPPGRASPVRWPERGRRKVLRLPVRRGRVLTAFPAPPVSRFDEVCAADLALVLLSKGEGARLKRALVGRGLAYSVGADFLTRRDVGLFCAYAVCPEEKVAEVRKVMLSEIRRVGEEGPSEEELSMAKGLLSGVFLLDTEGMVGMAGNLGFYETLRSHQLALTYLDRIRGVSVKGLVSVARQYLNPRRAVVVEVLPEEEGA